VGDNQERARVLKQLQGQRPETAAEVRIIARELDGPLHVDALELLSRVNRSDLAHVVLEIGEKNLQDLRREQQRYEQNKNEYQKQQLILKLENLEVIVQVLGRLKNESAVEFLKQVAQVPQLKTVASGAIGQMGRAQDLEEMIDRAKNDRAINVSSFGAQGLKRVVEKINDPATSRLERGALIEQIKGSADPAVNTQLQDLALHHPDEEVRSRAGLSLVNSFMVSDKPADPEFLIEWVKKEQTPHQTWGVYAMRNNWDERFIPVLIDLLKSSPHENVRANAAEALGMHKVQSAVPALEKALLDDESMVRSGSTHALRKILGTEEFLRRYDDIKYVHPDDKAGYLAFKEKQKDQNK